MAGMMGLMPDTERTGEAPVLRKRGEPSAWVGTQEVEIMNIICPTCNQSYDIPNEKLPKGRARAKCKNCGESILIEASGTVWAESSAAPSAGLAKSNAEAVAQHGVLMAYPALQSLSPNKVAFDEVFAANKKGHFKSRRNRLKVQILMAVADALDKLLNQGEQVMRVARGTAYYPAEIFLGNGWLTMMYNHYAIVATNQRVLCINVNSRMKRRTHYLFQVLYGDIKKVKRGWLGSLVFQRARSKRRVFTGVKRFMSKDLKDFIMQRKEQVEQEPEVVLENLCPSCFEPLQAGLKVCPSCKATFKEPKKASLRSLLLPGLGDFYLGHRALGILELMGSVMVWFVAAVWVLTGGLFMAAFVLLFYNGMDGMLAYHMAKKGYMLA
jgi:predicted Zn finger-like uncharacterized protein